MGKRIDPSKRWGLYFWAGLLIFMILSSLLLLVVSVRDDMSSWERLFAALDVCGIGLGIVGLCVVGRDLRRNTAERRAQHDAERES